MDTFVPNNKVLYVDDEGSLLTSFSSLMRRENVAVSTLVDSARIEETLASTGPFALVLSDQRMPALDGVAVLATVARLHPETVRVMVTGFADYTDTLRAINTGGISYYLSKPWKDEEMKQLVRDCILRFNLQAENKYLLGELKRKNEHLQELLEGTVGQTSRILSDLVGYVNPHASSQVGRVRKLGEAILTTLPELPSEERWEIQRALDLFNLGIAVLPAWMQVSINKEGLGSLSRFPIAKNHHLLAAGLLKDIPRFCGVSKIVLMQLKNFDGTGEPSDIVCRGKDIPLGARLLHILLDLDRLSTERFRGREVLEFMRKRPATYDVDLIARMLGDYATQPSTARIQDVTVDQLCPGMIPLSDILTKGGVLLLSSQTVLTETAICTIKQWHKNDPVVSPLEVQINS